MMAENCLLAVFFLLSGWAGKALTPLSLVRPKNTCAKSSCLACRKARFPSECRNLELVPTQALGKLSESQRSCDSYCCSSELHEISLLLDTDMPTLRRGLTQRSLSVLPTVCPSPGRRSPSHSLARGTPPLTQPPHPVALSSFCSLFKQE